MALTKHELELLPAAIKFCEDEITRTGKLPAQNPLRLKLGCREASARAIQNHIKENNLVAHSEEQAAPKGGTVVEQNTIKGDVWNITLPKTTIHTLDGLLEYCKVSLDDWEVDSWEANKWSMGYVARSVKHEQPADSTGVKTSTKENQSSAHDLYQVKAKLRRKRFATPTEYVKDNARLRSQLEKLKLRLASETSITKQLAQNHAGYDDLLADFKAFANTIGDFSIPSQPLDISAPLIMPAVGLGHSEDAVLLLSDTHFGDKIQREDTCGFPEYDLTISGNRFGYVIRKAKQCLTLHRAMYPIKKLYIWYGGDIGNGILHDSPNSNELFTPAQVHFSYSMLKFGLDELLELTVPDANGRVVVEEIVLLFTVGNHMRMDEKMPHKYQAQRTLDWLIYQFLIERFKGTPKVTIRQEMSPYIFENIRGHRHLFAHGMQVGYRNSPDAQCKSMGSFIDRVRALFDSPEWRRKNSLQGETFARICIGDIHVPVSFPRLISNGSLNGQNELGVNWVLEPIPAGQQLFGVADKHVETWKYFLDCTAVQKEKGDMNAYGQFAQDYATRIAR